MTAQRSSRAVGSSSSSSPAFSRTCSAIRYLGYSSGRASRIGHSSYSHRIAGLLAADAATLETYLAGKAASVTVLRPWHRTELATPVDRATSVRSA